MQEVEARLSDALAQLGELRRRIERAERFATTDVLTDLPNRRSFEKHLHELVAEAQANARPLSLVMLDVDHFKSFNDRYGHHVGDHVLRLIARAIAMFPDRGRFAARYGGEEFALILPGRGLDDAAMAAERIRMSLAKRRLRMRGPARLLDPITVSAGVAELAPGEQPESLIRRADVALYKAKFGGRNRVIAEQIRATA